MRFDWRAGLGIAISIFLLWWILRGVDLGAVWAGIRGADYLLLTLAVAVSTAGFLIRAIRWRILLIPLKPDTSLSARFRAVCIGFMANNLLPARAGEFARALAFVKMEPVPLSGSFGSLVVERFLDGMVILLLLAVALLLPGFPRGVTLMGQPMGAALTGASLLLMAVLVPVLWLLVWPAPLLRLALWVAGWFGDRIRGLVAGTLESFVEGLSSLRNPALLLPAVGWSVLFWCWHSFGFYLGFLAFGIEAGYGAALFLNAILAFFVAVPSSPGFFGTFHAGALVALQVFGIPDDRILAFAFGIHLGGFIPVTVLGLWFTWRLGLSLAEVGKGEARVEEEVERTGERVTAELSGGDAPGPGASGGGVER